MDHQLLDFEHAFLNVGKLIIPERKPRQHKKLYDLDVKHTGTRISIEENKLVKKKPKEHAKLELPTIQHKGMRSTPKTIPSEETLIMSKKKITNFSKYNQQQKNTSQEEPQFPEKKSQTEKLVLGLKKKPKGKMKELLQSVLKTTLVYDEIVIKRNPYQQKVSPPKHNSTRLSSLETKKVEQPEIQGQTGSNVSKKAFSQNKLKTPKLIKSALVKSNQVRQDLNLIDFQNHRNLVEMVKKEQSRKQRLRLERERLILDAEPKATQRTTISDQNGIKNAQKIVEIHNDPIPEQIQYSSQQREEYGRISEVIEQSRGQN